MLGANIFYRTPRHRRKDTQQIGDLGARVRVERNAAQSVGFGAFDLRMDESEYDVQAVRINAIYWSLRVRVKFSLEF